MVSRPLSKKKNNLFSLETSSCDKKNNIPEVALKLKFLHNQPAGKLAEMPLPDLTSCTYQVFNTQDIFAQ